MEEIGKLLKEKRETLGLSIEDVSERTRLTPKHIKALEQGELSFFREDLSYLRYFVKSYCDVVGLDFEDLKDKLRQDIHDYTTSFIVNTELSHQEMERNIANSEKLSNVKTKRKKMKVKKPDFSIVSLFAIITVVIVVILCAFLLYIRSNKDKNTISENRPIAPVQEEQGENEALINEKPSEEETKEEEKKELEITQGEDVKHFTLNNLKEGDKITVETTFNGSSSGYSVTVLDGSKSEVFNDKIYQYQETANTELTVKKGMKFNVYVGCMVQTEIKINGKAVKVDNSVNFTTYPGYCPSNTLEFSVGDLNESSK